MHDKILKALTHLQQQHSMKVLFAVESGSRAWGFESPDSDWDVRYIYVRPPEWYTAIDYSTSRDVIDQYHKDPFIKGTEFEDPLLDITGWDLQKALRMMRKSNPQLSEWLRSPVTYVPGIAQNLRDLELHCLHLYPAIEHYRSMAKANFREFLQGDRVRYKKYLYVLRPLMCAEYVRQFYTFPPVLFHEVMESVLPLQDNATELEEALNRLLALKAQASEIDDAPRDPVLHAYIKKQLASDWNYDEKHKPSPTSGLNQFFRSTVKRYWY